MTVSAAQRWQRLSKRQRFTATLLGGFLAVWTAYGLVLRPLAHRLGELDREVRDTEQRLLDAVAASRDAEVVNKAFKAYESYVKLSGSPDAEQAVVLSEVESAVRQSGMTLLNLKPATGRGGTEHAIGVTVDGEAAPEQLVRLLDSLPRSARLLKVTEFTVRVSEGKTLRTSIVINKLLLK